MSTPVSGQDLEDLAKNDKINLRNSAAKTTKVSDVTAATERSLRDFASEAGVKNLDVILENLRRSQDVTDGAIDGSSEIGP